MQETIISYATPVFFVLIAIELAVARWRGHARYRLNDAVSSIGLGVLSQVSGVFMRVLSIGIYAWFVRHVALFALPADNVLVWMSGLLLYDFCYYWLHRCGHEVNLLWAAHVVHHQSERYNLSTALRQTSTGVLFGWLFYLPLALLGYPVEVFAVIALIDLLYQFWIHTEEIGRLGWFDRVFASPSNHRAHHAVNDRYLDRNYGGILILWDRLFGTFVEESDEDRPVYGTRGPLRSWNPLWANVQVYWSTACDGWRARRWRDRLLIWLKPPGWLPADVAERFPKPDFDIRRDEYNPPVARAMAVYCLIQFGLLLGMSVHFLDVQAHAPMPTVFGYFIYLAFALVVLGMLMEARPAAAALELLRLVVTVALPLPGWNWFGTPLVPSMMAAFVGVFGASAIVLLLLARPWRALPWTPLSG